MWNEFLKTFGKLSVADLAKQELEHARKSLMETHTKVEYYTAMLEFEKNRVARLSQQVGETK